MRGLGRDEVSVVAAVISLVTDFSRWWRLQKSSFFLSRFFFFTFFRSARSPLFYSDQSPVSSAGFEVFGAGLTGHRKNCSKLFPEKKKTFPPTRPQVFLVLSVSVVFFGEGEFVRGFAKISVEIGLLGRIESPVKYRLERL